jgi:hypothetical protein
VVRKAVAFPEALFPGAVEEKKRAEVVVLDKGPKEGPKGDMYDYENHACPLLAIPFPFFSVSPFSV